MESMLRNKMMTTPEKLNASAVMHRLGIYRVHLVALPVATKKSEIKMFSILFASTSLRLARSVMSKEEKKIELVAKKERKESHFYFLQRHLCVSVVSICVDGWTSVLSIPSLGSYSLFLALPSPYRQLKGFFHTFKLMACFKKARKRG